ncbi:TPA: replication initiation factor domain-containing protein [Streptococcus agalactiae]|nr:replication initiation factor domain-containing protein [Streptococcus agalactiae]
MDNSVKIDYFAVTVKDVTPEFVIEELLVIPLSHFTLNEWGVNKYQCHYACSEIKVYFNLNRDSNMGVFIELKGQGCRQYEEFLIGNDNNWISLVQRLMLNNTNFTRFDIANDIYDGALNVQRLYDYSKKGLCITTARHAEYHEKFVVDSGELVGETVVFGARGNQQWCVYNKLMEQNGKLQSDIDINSWVRAELRCWQEKANLIANQLNDMRPLASIYFEAINGHYRFVSPKARDKNKRRRESVRWWQNYINTEEKTRLSIVREKPTLRKSEAWTDKQVSKTIAKVYMAKYEAYGIDQAEFFLQNLLRRGVEKFTDNDEKEIEQYVREQQSSENWGIKKADL